MKKHILVTLMMACLLILATAAFAEVPQEINAPKVLTADETWTGDFLVTEDIDLAGHTLTVNGNLILTKKSLKINGGSLVVTGDFRIQSIKGSGDGVDYAQLTEADFQFCKGLLKMDTPKDRVLVMGNFYPNGDNNVLRAGTIELKGNFVYSTNAYIGCYDATGTHKTIFSGEGDQTVTFARSGSRFNILNVEKPSGKMIFKSPVDIRAFDKDTVIPVGGNGYLYLETYLTNKVNLNGKTLTVNGNLIFSRGDIVFGGGRLVVDGDFRLQGISSMQDKADVEYEQLVTTDFKVPTDAQLTMTNAKDYMLVRGNAYFQSSKEAKGLRAGTMEFQRDFYQLASTPKSFIAYDKHKTILSGGKSQTIYFTAPSYIGSDKKLRQYNQFNVLDIKCPVVKLTYSEKLSSTAKKAVKVIANQISPKNFKFK